MGARPVAAGERTATFMWHVRNNPVVASTVAATAALVLVSGCTPDAPDGGVPTHPSDRFSITFAWDAPTTDAVGDPLEDLAGYRLYFDQTTPPNGPGGTVIEVGDTTRYTVDDLSPGSYYFAVTALDQVGNESDISDPLPLEVGR